MKRECTLMAVTPHKEIMVKRIEISRESLHELCVDMARNVICFDKPCGAKANRLGKCVVMRGQVHCFFCGEPVHAVNHVYVYTANIITKEPLEDVCRVEEKLDSLLPLYQRLVIPRDEPTRAEASLYGMDEWFNE